MATGGEEPKQLEPEQLELEHESDEEEIIFTTGTRRTRTLTEKGVKYKIDQLHKKRAVLLCKLNEKGKIVEEASKKEPVGNELVAYHEEFRNCFSTFLAVHKEYIELLSPEEAKKANDWASEIIVPLQELDQKVYRICQSVARSSRELEDDQLSHRSKASSKRSHGSVRSTVSMTEKRADAAAKRAALEAALKFKQDEETLRIRQEKVQAERNRLQAEQDQLKLQRDIAIADAEEQVYSKFDTPEDEYYHTMMPVQAWMPSAPLNPNVRPINPTIETSRIQNQPSSVQVNPPESKNPSFLSESNVQSLSNTDTLTCILKNMAELQSRSRLPCEEPEMFDGDIVEFVVWLRDFEDLVESNTSSPSQRLRLLSKYTSGEAKESIKGLVGLKTEEAYLKAKETLTEWFGDSSEITRALKVKLKNWSFITTTDGGHALRKFSHFLLHCKVMSQDTDFKISLDDEDLNQELTLKLPKGMRDRWAKKVMDYKTTHKRYPPFSLFCEHVKYEAKLATMPVTGTAVMDKLVSERKPKRNRNVGGGVAGNKPSGLHSFATAVQVDLCHYCKETSHVIDDCPQFEQISYDERVTFVKSNGLCFGCLVKGHMSSKCPERRTCQKCKKRHPTLLHNNRFKDKKPSVQVDDIVVAHYSITDNSHSTTTRIIPVLIQIANEHKEKPFLATYAVLDEQSNSSFISKELLQRIHKEGTKVNLQVSTVTTTETVESTRVENLVIKSYNGGDPIILPQCYSRPSIPANRQQILRKETLGNFSKFEHLRNEIPEYLPDLEIGLLIGTNCVKALEPVKVLYDNIHHCYAVLSGLGWSTVGFKNKTEERNNCETSVCHKTILRNQESITSRPLRTQAKEILPCDVLKSLTQDFFESREEYSEKKGMSVMDKRFLNICEDNIKKIEGRYELPLPFKNQDINLPCNKKIAIKRLLSLKKRFEDSSEFKKQYTEFMNSMFENNYAEEVSANENIPDGKKWFLPHHAVVHPNKKLRVVFDASAKYQEVSLNEQLLSGPDLANNMIGVILRFRKKKIAVAGDIAKMFLQIKVKPEHRNFLSFVWWPNGNTNLPLKEFRMSSHLFGAVSSPSIANFVLKYTADTMSPTCGEIVRRFVQEDFYVDDGLTSVETTQQAIKLITMAKKMCAGGGFNLTKFICNDKSVLKALPVEDLAPDVKDIDFTSGFLPMQHALGLKWNVEDDTFYFTFNLKDKPMTRRGMLSMVSSIYDPIGLISPIILIGKRMLQELCNEKKSWDEPISESCQKKWSSWMKDLNGLDEIKIPRCVKPNHFKSIVTQEIHHFSDASMEHGYGQCSYLRIIDKNEGVHCSLLMSKSRVVPKKRITVPRLELNAAVVSAKIAHALRREMKFENMKEYFWTDSKITLGYIQNESRRFHVYVCNRVEEIHKLSHKDQWNYIPTKENPADICSRGSTVKKLLSKHSEFLNGPKFLYDPKFHSDSNTSYCVDPDDVEVMICSKIEVNEEYKNCLMNQILRNSSWTKMKKFVASLLRVKEYLIAKNRKENFKFEKQFSVEELKSSETEIICLLQESSYSIEIKRLKNKMFLLNSSNIRSLDPFLDDMGVIRVGGRLKSSSLPENIKYPILLPNNNDVTKALIRYYHELSFHQGRGITLNCIRSHGYWITKASSEVKTCIYKCVLCRKLRGKSLVQKMSNLPLERIEQAPPFSYTGLDVFGPFFIRQGRNDVKRYALLLTCMQCRAVRIEVLPSMTTSAFLNALRRFICRNGPIRKIVCDQGSNFKGAENEILRELKKMNNGLIQSELSSIHNCDYVPFSFNPPSASHFGGIWERQIRSVRSILTSLLLQHGQQLDEDSLNTFMIEAETTVNCRPLCIEQLNSSDSILPLSPHNLLTNKTNVVLPPPGNFESVDLYSKKRWRRIQHLSNEFWSRWKKEFLLIQQSRQKWHTPKREIRIGDIVIIVDNPSYRNQWSLGRIVEVTKSQDGLIRKAKCQLSTKDKSSGYVKFNPTIIERPVHKLVLIMEE